MSSWRRQESVEKISEFNSQDLANTAWIFATLEVKIDELLEAVRYQCFTRFYSCCSSRHRI